MKELDCIEVIVEKKKYTEDGVHKGMTGWICYNKCVDGYWLFNLGPRVRALPVADIARAQSVPWSAGDAAVCGKETAGYHKRTAGEVCKNLPFTRKNA